jgi:hypothetical protein
MKPVVGARGFHEKAGRVNENLATGRLISLKAGSS